MIFFKSLFQPKGLVGPHMTQHNWDEQFAGDKWDYLGDENQREHYSQIVDLYSKYCKGGTVLDIGCGVGVLYRCFIDSGVLDREQYTGIDISTVAIADAKKSFAGIDFRVVNYDAEIVNELYDVLIFNETIYYFNHAGDTLLKSFKNLKPEGKVIISMCDHERHDLIWDYIDLNYKVLETKECRNNEDIAWTVKIITAQ